VEALADLSLSDASRPYAAAVVLPYQPPHRKEMQRRHEADQRRIKAHRERLQKIRRDASVSTAAARTRAQVESALAAATAEFDAEVIAAVAAEVDVVSTADDEPLTAAVRATLDWCQRVRQADASTLPFDLIVLIPSVSLPLHPAAESSLRSCFTHVVSVPAFGSGVRHMPDRAEWQTDRAANFLFGLTQYRRIVHADVKPDTHQDDDDDDV
jgi:hypothetical protein